MPSLNFRKFLNGIKLKPKQSSTSSSGADGKGDLEVLTSGKLNYNNGSSVSPVVTEDHQATLTQKTLTFPKIDTIDGVTGTDLTVQSVSNQDLILQSQGSGDVFVKTSGTGDVNLQANGTGDINLSATAGDIKLTRGVNNNTFINSNITPTLGGVNNVYINSSTELNPLYGNGKVKIEDLTFNGTTLFSGNTSGLDGTSVIINGITMQNSFGAIPFNYPQIYPNGSSKLRISSNSDDLLLEQGTNNILQLGQQTNFATTLVRSNSDFKANKKFIIEKQYWPIGSGVQTNLVLSPVNGYLYLAGTGVTSLSVAGINSSIADNKAGQIIIITNDTDSNLTILNQSGATTPENRILTGLGSNVTVSQGGSVTLIYDNDEGLIGNPARWRLLNGIQTSGGGSGTNITTINASTTLTPTNDIVLVNGTGITITLPNPGTLVAGKTFNIKKIWNDTVAVTITPASGTIDGVASVAITDQYDSLTITTDGANYFII